MNNLQSSSWESLWCLWTEASSHFSNAGQGWCWKAEIALYITIHTRDSCIKKATCCKGVPEPVQVITKGHVTTRYLYKTVSPVGWWSTSPGCVECKWNMRNSFFLLFCPTESQKLSPTSLLLQRDFLGLARLSLSLCDAKQREETYQILNCGNILRCMHAFTYTMYTNMKLFTHPFLAQIHRQCKITPHPAASYF